MDHQHVLRRWRRPAWATAVAAVAVALAVWLAPGTPLEPGSAEPAEESVSPIGPAPTVATTPPSALAPPLLVPAEAPTLLPRSS